MPQAAFPALKVGAAVLLLLLSIAGIALLFVCSEMDASRLALPAHWFLFGFSTFLINARKQLGAGRGLLKSDMECCPALSVVVCCSLGDFALSSLEARIKKSKPKIANERGGQCEKDGYFLHSGDASIGFVSGAE